MSTFWARWIQVPQYDKKSYVWEELKGYLPESMTVFKQQFHEIESWLSLKGLDSSLAKELQQIFNKDCRGFSYLLKNSVSGEEMLLLEGSQLRLKMLFELNVDGELGTFLKELHLWWKRSTETPKEWNFGSRRLSFSDGHTHIMGILNVTPDSFSDGGTFFAREKAIEQGLKLLEEGADIIDIGGESTRPKAKLVEIKEELLRVIPVIEGIKKHRKDAIISIDTRKVKIAKAALDVGAEIVNDVSMLRFEPQLAKLVADYDAHLILMHSRHTPKVMQEAPFYRVIWKEICEELEESLQLCMRVGIKRERIAVDPGIGFGKRFQDNCRILRELDVFQGLGLPIVMGASRKSFIGDVLGTSTEKRLEGSLAAAAVALNHGAKILRVHDVLETRQFVKMLNAIWRSSIQ